MGAKVLEFPTAKVLAKRESIFVTIKRERIAILDLLLKEKKKCADKLTDRVETVSLIENLLPARLSKLTQKRNLMLCLTAVSIFLLGGFTVFFDVSNLFFLGQLALCLLTVQAVVKTKKSFLAITDKHYEKNELASRKLVYQTQLNAVTEDIQKIKAEIEQLKRSISCDK